MYNLFSGQIPTNPGNPSDNSWHDPLNFLVGLLLGLLLSPFEFVGYKIAQARHAYLIKKYVTKESFFKPQTILLAGLKLLLLPLEYLGNTLSVVSASIALDQMGFSFVEIIKQTFTYNFCEAKPSHSFEPIVFTEATLEWTRKIPESEQWGVSYWSIRKYDEKHSNLLERIAARNASAIIAQGASQENSTFAKTGSHINQRILEYVAQNPHREYIPSVGKDIVEAYAKIEALQKKKIEVLQNKIIKDPHPTKSDKLCLRVGRFFGRFFLPSRAKAKENFSENSPLMNRC